MMFFKLNSISDTMIINKIIKLYKTEWQYYHGMVVHYYGKKFIKSAQRPES